MDRDEADPCRVFDEGPFRREPEVANAMVNRLLSIMRGEEQSEPKGSLIETHDLIWQRIAEVCP